MTEHTYPFEYTRGENWAIDEAWDILDRLKPGTIPDDVRAWLAGIFAGRLERAANEGEPPHGSTEQS